MYLNEIISLVFGLEGPPWKRASARVTLLLG